MRRKLRSAPWNHKLPLRVLEALIFLRIASPAITPVIPSGVEGSRGAVLKVTHRDPSTVAQDDPRRVRYPRQLSRQASRCATVSSVSSPMLERRKVWPLILP